MKKSVSFFLGTLLSDQPASNEATNCRVSRMSGPHLKSWRQQRPGCIQKINIFYFRDLFFSPRVGYRGALYTSTGSKVLEYAKDSRNILEPQRQNPLFPDMRTQQVRRCKFSRNRTYQVQIFTESCIYSCSRARHGNRRRKTYILQHLQLCKTNAYIQCALIFIGNPL